MVDQKTGAPAGAKTMASARLLLIDDDVAVLRGLDRGLSRIHEVETISDPEAGLQAAIEGDHDLILVDIHMPQMTGFDLFERLKAAAPARAERLVFCTAAITNSGLEKAVLSTGRPVLFKPLTVADLVPLLLEA